ncbi:protein FAM149A isoform X2 [Rhinatrema bivittatum]|uniref:protein FAM149A isoform X2 n=1 Tax=Rhinatrema bivittatum TaxID=194408 RepID=UPI00112E39DD|nr:protein FAM149A isoform X2 [Rhinatrema bivittatum]
MKVAVLDLGTVFARIFKTSAPAPSGGGSNFPHASTATPAPSAAKAATGLLLLPPPPPSPLVSPLPRIPSATAGGSGSSLPGSPGLSVSRAPPPPALSLPRESPSSRAPTPAAHIPVLVRPAHTPSPLPIPAGRAALSPGSGLSPLHASPSRSPRLQPDPPGPGWSGPGSKALLITLPDIGEEWLPETDSDDWPGDEKGLSRGAADQSTADKVGYSLPVDFTRQVQEAIHNYSCESVSSISTSGQTTPTDLNNSWSGIQSYTTGLSTERSSVYSWTDDEFDKANTQRVHQLFWDVDEMLFEGHVSSQTQSLQAECKEWTKRSLHLRILGKQLILPMDEGFQHFQSRATSSVYTRSLPGLTGSSDDMKELCISGSRLVPTASPLHKAFEPTSSGSSIISDSSIYSFLEEEIYDVDGKIEEYLAYDSKEHDDEGLEQKKAQFHRKRNKRGIPPISPNACIKDAVAAEVFDDVWRDVLSILEDFITKNWEATITDGDKQIEKMKYIGCKLLPMPVCRLTTETASVPPSRGSEARSFSFGSHSYSSQAHRMASNFYNDLNGVMTIQAKPLQHRHAGLIDKAQNEQDDRSLGVGSSVLASVRSRLGRIADNSILSASRVLQASPRKTPAQRRLPSLSSEPLRSKTPNVYSDGVLRGTKLYMGLDRLSSPSVQMTQNKLPPINSETTEQHLTVPGSRYTTHRGRYPHSRVSSAVPDTTGRRPLKERIVFVDQFSRPNTTHTFRVYSCSPNLSREIHPQLGGGFKWPCNKA